MEVWKTIKGFEDYEVSNYGNVRNIKKNKILKSKKDRSGYLSLSLYLNGVKKFKYIHRLIALNFIEEIEGKPFVNHKDGNKLNNLISNLEWCTHKENCQHSIKNKLQIPFIGEQCGNSKLKEKDVLKIRNLYNKENISQQKIAKIYNITQANVYSIVNLKTWKHI
jgi:predicted XRE-type DNA-binding protein